MQTVYFHRSKIPFTVTEWNKIKSYANFLSRQHGEEIEDRSEGMDEVHLRTRSEDKEQMAESFYLFQAIYYTGEDEERGYNFNFTKTYSIEPFESTILSILRYARYIAPWVLLEVSADSYPGSEEVIL
jgi:hypothetical protein